MNDHSGILHRGENHGRGMKFLRGVACITLAAQLMVSPFAFASDAETKAKPETVPAAAAPDVVLKTMQTELARATTGLAKSDPAPYFLSYTVYDQNVVILVGAYGSLLTDTAVHRRQADVTMRVGSPALDNTHGQARASGIVSGTLPFGDNQDAIARVLWELTDRAYKRAGPAFLNVKTNTAVKAEEEDKSPDFSKETPVQHTGEPLTVPPFDKGSWESEIRRLSAEFRKYPDVYFASIVLQVQSANERKVTSEEDLTDKIEKMATDLNALRKAPVAEPYDGPALLSGRAAAVFFHEVLGHRLEGHRQKDEDDGQ